MNNYGIEDWGMIVILDEMNDRIDLLEIEMKKNITTLMILLQKNSFLCGPYFFLCFLN